MYYTDDQHNILQEQTDRLELKRKETNAQSKLNQSNNRSSEDRFWLRKSKHL